MKNTDNHDGCSDPRCECRSLEERLRILMATNFTIYDILAIITAEVAAAREDEADKCNEHIEKQVAAARDEGAVAMKRRCLEAYEKWILDTESDDRLSEIITSLPLSENTDSV